MTAHEDYLGMFVTAIKRGNKVISAPCPQCKSKTVVWTTSSVDPSYFYHKVVGGEEHRIAPELLSVDGTLPEIKSVLGKGE